MAMVRHGRRARTRPSGWKWLSAVATILGLFLGYLGLAVALDWFPFSPSDELRITQPGNNYTIRSDFQVEIEGKTHGSKEVWVVARDENGDWFPLDRASQRTSTIWTSTIRYDQFGSSTADMELHAIAAVTSASQELSNYIERGSFDRGLGDLPEGAEDLHKIDVDVAK